MSSHWSCLGTTQEVLGYAAWEGSPMRTKTIPRYPVLAAHESAQANAVEGMKTRSRTHSIAEAILKTHQAYTSGVTSETRSDASRIHGLGAAGKGKEQDSSGTAAEHGQHHEGSGHHTYLKSVRRPGSQRAATRQDGHDPPAEKQGVTVIDPWRK